MPELPEVEAARRAIQSTCINKKIKRSIIADDTKVIDGVSQSDFQSSLSGKTIVAAHRKGKNLWLELDSPPFPSFQFGMSGAVYIKGIAVTQYKRSAVKEDEEWPSKYSKVFIELDDGLELSFTDKRRFAKVRLLNDPASVPPISELGPDALLEPMKSNDFAEALSKKRTAIKTLLLDQSFISGIGNWVADEVLYQARIHPMQIASSLSKENCEALHASIKEVIEKAVEAEADSSKYPSNWIFHSREMKPGKAFVDGKKIEFITVGSRTSAFVPELQKLTGGQTEKKARKSKAAKKESEEDEASKSEEEENEKPKSKKKASTKKPSKNAEEDKTQKSAKGGAKKKKIEEIEEPSESVEEEKTQKSAKRGAKKKKIEEIEEPSEKVEEEKTQKSAKRGAKKKRIEEIEEPSENVEEEKTQKSAKGGAKKKRIEDIKEPSESAEEEKTQKSAKRGTKKKRIEDIKEPSESAEEEKTQKSAKRGTKKKRIEDIEEPSKSAEEEKAQKSAKRGANKKKIEDGNGGSNQKKKTKK